MLKDWQLIGLDSAYDSSNVLYETGSLRESQLAWLRYQLQTGAETGRRSIVLTHHNPVSALAKLDKILIDQVCGAARGSGLTVWYWAHEQAGIRFPRSSQAFRLTGRSRIWLATRRSPAGRRMAL